jgi:hypothetical protein
MLAKIRRTGAVVASLGLVVGLLGVSTTAQAASATTTGGSFYTYTGTKPLADIAPGTVLKTRTVSYHVAGIPLPLTVVQLLYRSTGSLDQPTTNVTSVIKPPVDVGAPEAVSYQSFYDSLDPADEPSQQIAGGVTLGGSIVDVEAIFIAPLLLQGYAVIVPDTEGQAADFAAGPEYGMNTLDSIRAATHSSATGLATSTRVGLLGYSGGAIATDWAAQLAPTYAPAVNRELVGAAEGGVLVDPIHNLSYVSGSLVWSGVLPMALIGIARAFHLDLTPYLSSYGKEVVAKLADAGIANVLGEYPGLTFAQLVKPQYANPDSIAVLVDTANKLDMGTAASPTVPMLIGQGADGLLEGTSGDKAGIGAGDGVMIAGDVRTLARQFCASGVPVSYTQYDALSHVTTAPVWAPTALAWLDGRFDGLTAPDNCSDIATGNSLAPAQVVAPGKA